MKSGNQHRRRILARLTLILLLSAGIAACGPSIEEILAAEQVARDAKKTRLQDEAARQERAAREYAESETLRLLINEQITAASDDSLHYMILKCLSAVRSHLSDHRGPFRPYLVDEYSADLYLAMTGGYDTIEERVSSIRRHDNYAYANSALTFDYIDTRDSFSGPIKEARGLTCQLGPGLEITGVR